MNDDERNHMLETLDDKKAWLNYSSGDHIICPICFASIYKGYYDHPQGEAFKQAHIAWHERNNV